MGRKNVLIEADARDFVGYFGLRGQIDRGYPLEERLEEPPTGTVYEREYVLLKDAVDEDGEPLEQLNGFLLKAGPRKFLRGTVVTGSAATKLLLPPFLVELISLAEKSGGGLEVMGEVPPVIAVTQADGTEVGIPLQGGEIPPPEGASPYAVGESPEEIEAAELEQIREDAKNGVYDEEEEAAVGGGHPVIPFPDSDDDGLDEDLK